MEPKVKFAKILAACANDLQALAALVAQHGIERGSEIWVESCCPSTYAINAQGEIHKELCHELP
jgi:hypothetical protein